MRTVHKAERSASFKHVPKYNDTLITAFTQSHRPATIHDTDHK